jgi:uncharacterized protein YktA (UPF0223 family)
MADDAASTGAQPGEESYIVSSTEDLKRVLESMMQVESEAKDRGADVRELNKKKRAMKQAVMDFMQEKKLDRLKLKKRNEIIEIDHKESAGSLTRKRLVEAIKYLNGVEDYNIEEWQVDTVPDNVAESLAVAQRQLDTIIEYLDRDKDVKVELIRRPMDKKRRDRKPAPPLSVFAKSTKKAKTDEEDEEDGPDLETLEQAEEAS